MHDLDDFIRQAGAELAAYDEHGRRFEGLLQENDKRLHELRGRREEAWKHLGEIALPDRSEAALSALAARLNLPGLETIARETAARRDAIAARLAEIDALPLYADRESHRVHLQAQLDEEAPLYDFARAELDKMEALPGMQELLDDAWGTERYEIRGWTRFFNPEFLKDWKHADGIIEALGAADFEEVARRYSERSEQVQVLGESVQRLRGQQAEIDRLEAERAALLAEREALPEKMQGEAGRMLGQTLQSRGPDAISGFPSPDTVQRIFTTGEGIEHQSRYLEEMNGRIRGDLAQLMERSGRLREEMRRYEHNRHRYRNKRFTDEQFAKRFGRAGRYHRLHDRYANMSSTVYVFDDYDRGNALGDFLWWDVMTDGRFDGNFIPEVSEWRERHPHYAYSSHSSHAGFASEPDQHVQRDDS